MGRFGECFLLEGSCSLVKFESPDCSFPLNVPPPRNWRLVKAPTHDEAAQRRIAQLEQTMQEKEAEIGELQEINTQLLNEKQTKRVDNPKAKHCPECNTLVFFDI